MQLNIATLLGVTVALLGGAQAQTNQATTCQYSLFHVEALETCGDYTYYPGSHVCCNGVVNRRTGSLSDPHACCGTEWAPLSQCCNGVYADPDKDQACCGETVYDTTTSACCGGQQTVQLTGDNTACCLDNNSPKQYKRTEQTCCGNVLRDYPEDFPTVKPLCCAGTYTKYNSSTSSMQCCTQFNGLETVPYNTNTQQCCDGTAVTYPDKTPTAELQCCGTQLYNTTEQDCCGVTPVSKREDSSCCLDTFISNLGSRVDCCSGLSVYNTANYQCNVESCEVCESDNCLAVTSSAALVSPISALFLAASGILAALVARA